METELKLPAWKKIRECKPKNGGKYLCYDEKRGEYTVCFGGMLTDNITHWTELPPIPKHTCENKYLFSEKDGDDFAIYELYHGAKNRIGWTPFCPICGEKA